MQLEEPSQLHILQRTVTSVLRCEVQQTWGHLHTIRLGQIIMLAPPHGDDMAGSISLHQWGWWSQPPGNNDCSTLSFTIGLQGSKDEQFIHHQVLLLSCSTWWAWSWSGNHPCNINGDTSDAGPGKLGTRNEIRLPHPSNSTDDMITVLPPVT